MNIRFKTAVIILVGAFTLLFNNIAVAGNEKKNTNTNNFVELRYAGRSAQQPMFHLAINDSSAAGYTVTVKEDNGEILFSEKLSGQVKRTYLLDTDDADRIQGTTFEVTNRSTNITTVYKISNLTQTVENMIVSKL